MEFDKPCRDLFYFIYEAKNEKFSILFDTNNNSLEFCYWHQYMDHFHLDKGNAFKAKRKEAFMLDSDGDFVRIYSDIQRGLVTQDSAYKISDKGLKLFKTYYKKIKLPDKIRIINNTKNLSLQDVKDESKKYPNKILVFISCTFEAKNVDYDKDGVPLLSSLQFDQDVAFFDCTFNDKVVLRGSTFLSNLWFADCTFSDQFSLKNAKVSKNVHMESNCFSGRGGASFRGLKAKNLYVDFGTAGSDDMFWFNELKVSGVVSIGGNFSSKIQVLSSQYDPTKHKINTKIGELHIGTEYTNREADEDNITISDNAIEIKGLKAKSTHIFHVGAVDIKISHNSFERLHLKNISISNDLEIDNNNVTSDLRIDKSSIGRHMYIQKNQISCLMSLSKTSVSEVSYIENNTFDNKRSAIDFSRFTTSKFMFHPIRDLYADVKNSIFNFKPTKFSLLMANAQDLGEQYCALKHWLADAGKLKEEDMAYFHMNENFNKDSLWSKLVLGGIFGWGVRLTNIVVSSFALMLTFFVIYVSYGMDPMASIAVTIQGFFGVLLDPVITEWTSAQHEHGVSGVDIPSWLLTLESILGVLFITVLIGAYVRKMLR